MEDKRWLLLYLFGHSGFLLDILLLNGNQRRETSLHLEDGEDTHTHTKPREQQAVRVK